jgi:hypothetical protein
LLGRPAASDTRAQPLNQLIPIHPQCPPA